MDKKDLFLEKLKLASELHRHMDNLMWQQFYYFITLTASLFAAFGLLQSKLLKDMSRIESVANIGIPIFGICVSIIFALIFKRTQAFHSYRVKQAQRVEESLDEEMGQQAMLKIYKGIHEQNFTKVDMLSRTSINKLIFYMSIITTGIWLYLLMLVA